MNARDARIKAGVALGLMLASVAGAEALRPRRHLAESRAAVKLEQLFPEAFGRWRIDRTGPVQLVAPDAEALLKQLYSETLSRAYVDGRGGRIMLSVAYGGDQSDATRAHRPEVCYPAQGFQLMASREGTIALDDRPLRVRQLVARLGGRNEPISYWIVVGERVTVTGTEQKLAQLRYSLRGTIPDGMLVRVSNISTDTAASFALHRDFVAQLARALDPRLAPRVIGAGEA